MSKLEHPRVSKLEHPDEVVEHLRKAVDSLDAACRAAGEKEGNRRDLNGFVRDMIFGLNTSVDTLAEMINERVLR